MEKPILISNLHKGRFITKREIMESMDVPNEEDYWKYQMAYCQKISDYFKCEGIVLTIKYEKQGLRILTDKEAVPYLWEAFKKRIKGMIRDEERMKGVDTSELSSEEDERKAIIEAKMVMINQSIKRTSEKQARFDEPLYNSI